MRYKSAILCCVCLVVLPGCIGDAFVGVGGIVVDRSGKPLAGVEVTLKPGPKSDCDADPDRRTTTSSGQFDNLLGFSPATKKRDFVIQFKKDGYIPQTFQIHGDGMREMGVTLSRATEGPGSDPKPAPGGAARQKGR